MRKWRAECLNAEVPTPIETALTFEPISANNRRKLVTLTWLYAIKLVLP